MRPADTSRPIFPMAWILTGTLAIQVCRLVPAIRGSTAFRHPPKKVMLKDRIVFAGTLELKSRGGQSGKVGSLAVTAAASAVWA